MRYVPTLLYGNPGLTIYDGFEVIYETFSSWKEVYACIAQVEGKEIADLETTLHIKIYNP